MTVAQAKALLEKPVFGDPECIKAVRLLEDEEEAAGLRVKLSGKRVLCWCCEGFGEIDCKSGCTHECPTCDGSTGSMGLLLTAALLAKLALYQLRDLDKEVTERIAA